MKACKVIPSQNDTATLVCPHCGFNKDVNVAKFKNRRDSLKVRCRCQSTFAVSFEYRRALRKETNLNGYYQKLPECKEGGKIVIKDVSETGIRFVTVEAHNFKEGDKVRLKFTLDDTKRSELTMTAIVRWTGKANSIGCEFTDRTPFEKSYKALGFYLMSLALVLPCGGLHLL